MQSDDESWTHVSGGGNHNQDVEQAHFGRVDGCMAQDEDDIACGRFNDERFLIYNMEMNEESRIRMKTGVHMGDMAAGLFSLTHTCFQFVIRID